MNVKVINNLLEQFSKFRLSTNFDSFEDKEIHKVLFDLSDFILLVDEEGLIIMKYTYFNKIFLVQYGKCPHTAGYVFLIF